MEQGMVHETTHNNRCHFFHVLFALRQIHELEAFSHNRGRQLLATTDTMVIVNLGSILLRQVPSSRYVDFVKRASLLLQRRIAN